MRDGKNPIYISDIDKYKKIYIVKPPCFFRISVNMSSPIIIPADLNNGVYELHLINKDRKYPNNIILFSIGPVNMQKVEDTGEGLIDTGYKVCCKEG